MRQSTEFSSFTGSGSDTVFSGLLSQTPGQREEPGCGGAQTQGLTHMSRPALTLHCWSLHLKKKRENECISVAHCRCKKYDVSSFLSAVLYALSLVISKWFHTWKMQLAILHLVFMHKFVVNKCCIYLIKNKFSKNCENYCNLKEWLCFIIV